MSVAAKRSARTRRDAIRAGAEILAGAGCETPRLDAEVLLADALATSRERLLLDGALELDARATRAFDSALHRRAGAREPVAFITGRRAFRALELAVDARALIPRPETELLVEIGLTLPAGASVLDVGTGCGAIALALKHERPDLRVSAAEVDRGALALARENARALQIEVAFVHADLLAGVPDGFDAVLANLPYVAEGERETLAPEILEHEPPRALFAGPDGLSTIRALLEQASERARVGVIALEVGAGQAEAVAELARARGFADVETERDLAGIERAIVARRRARG
ncbi:MAG TPA: peptide chain release factor N(5)-glutamine methyltransferase [Solirubrobacteraceae bacterium]|nr:peptide chain release factor N(5)-glutamine methyltransferase [Solirubrobacteraceae bacterium]